MEDHKSNCRCYKCEGIDVDKMEKEAMDSVGFYIHFITEHDNTSPTGINIHTHGIQKTYGVPDLQVVVSVPPAAIHGIFHDVVARIKDGEKFEPNKIYTDIVANSMPTIFKWAVEGDRNVLRMIVCDPDKNVEEGTMINPYPVQYEGTSSEPILKIN